MGGVQATDGRPAGLRHCVVVRQCRLRSEDQGRDSGNAAEHSAGIATRAGHLRALWRGVGGQSMVRESVLIVAVAVTGVAAGSGGQRAMERGRATFADGTTVTLEIADTEAERQRGLMHRESLAAQAGMLFVFDKPGFYPFWMQNCRIALDIVWLDDKFNVVSIAESVPPCRLPGCEPPCASLQ